MRGPGILVRTLSRVSRADRGGARWQYHSRSDHHSKVACWCVALDLLGASPLLRRHVETGAVCFGVNHELRDFARDRKKNLDLVLCTPARPPAGDADDLASMAVDWGLDLDDGDRAALAALPRLRRAPVGAVLAALEAKACMTAHQRALPRLYDELNSSHLTVHGASEEAVAAGFVMVNAADRYLSPDLNRRLATEPPVWSVHRQPRDAGLAIDKVRQLPRRSRPGETGYDALAIVVVDFPNDGSPVRLVDGPPAPQPGDIHHWDQMIARLANVYATRFKDLS